MDPIMLVNSTMAILLDGMGAEESRKLMEPIMRASFETAVRQVTAK